ncbi:hypothetical protein ACRALDRAFT_2032965, partial [Sodiomyces alcalophilus JCM 7366]|uniref:uncharacterized protein n=1 Tax=Sodiomyces alcalophilus JCM 7366 TaxID=591952 RepID=UPI0039B4DFD8
SCYGFFFLRPLLYINRPRLFFDSTPETPQDEAELRQLFPFPPIHTYGVHPLYPPPPRDTVLPARLRK